MQKKYKSESGKEKLARRSCYSGTVVKVTILALIVVFVPILLKYKAQTSS
jgi:hypothetical protein